MLFIRERQLLLTVSFEYSFIVPKDIPMEFGKGKLSYYVNDIELGDGSKF